MANKDVRKVLWAWDRDNDFPNVSGVVKVVGLRLRQQEEKREELDVVMQKDAEHQDAADADGGVAGAGAGGGPSG